MKKIKIRLAEILKERNMSQKELSELADVRPNAISNLCREYVDRLSIEHLEKISDALKLDNINDLIELVDEKKA